MRVTEGLLRLAGAAVRRPLLTLAIVAALAIAGAVLALGLTPSAATDTFVNGSSPAYRATVQDQRRFGDDAIVVLIRRPVGTLLRSANLTALTELEACLAGDYVTRSSTLRADVPVSGHAAYGGPSSPCGQLMRTKPAQVVYGPGTFLNRAVAAINQGVSSEVKSARTRAEQAGAAARTLALGQGLSTAQANAAARQAQTAELAQQLERLEKLAAGSGLSEVPSISDGAFVRSIVFGSGAGASATPKARFAYLFPGRDSALIQVRLKASLSSAAQSRAITAIRRAVRMPMFAAATGGTATVTGVPVVVNDLAGQISGAIGGLLIAAVIVMAVALLLVFRTRLRLLPLAVALAAAGITFGVFALAGAQLTMASIAVLPILIGLAVDYGVQFQARTQEAREAAAADGAAPPRAARAVTEAVAAAAPSILTAACATAVGFLVLQLSPVPMVRGFGLLLVVGVAIALLCALTAGSAALVVGEHGGGRVAASLRGAGEILAPPLRGAGEILAPPARALQASLRGAGELLRLRSVRSVRSVRPERLLVALTRHPGRVLAVGLVLAALGWVVDGRTAVQSDITKLVPQQTAAIRGLQTLETVTGTSGEIDVAVRGSDVATPAVLKWMSSYEDEVLARYGGSASSGKPCHGATLCPALSLPDLFSTGTGSGSTSTLTAARIDALLRAVPSYFSSAVLTSDHREATLAFGIRLMPLARQQAIIDWMRAHLHPPAGTTAALTGLPVLAALADTELSSSGRRYLTLVIGLIAVALVLLLVLRRPRRALVPLVPIVLATGWSALILYLVGIPLNPMSASLGTLVIAISTEFSVLLSERFEAERATGHGLQEALARTYRRTGAAVLVSGVTAIVGFGVLTVSDITMLRDFGLVTLVDLTVSLLGVLLVLPAVLAAGTRGDTEPAAQTVGPRRRRWRPGRRASVA
jgi:hydrophobe/amphiphile efflux-3 (HAE3) family protein